jgi:hypothetical protein
LFFLFSDSRPAPLLRRGAGFIAPEKMSRGSFPGMFNCPFPLSRFGISNPAFGGPILSAAIPFPFNFFPA